MLVCKINELSNNYDKLLLKKKKKKKKNHDKSK